MSRQTAKAGDTILLRYALRLENGAVIVSNFADAEPERIHLGDGTLATGLEQQVIGQAEGDHKCVLLPPEESFGRVDPALVHTLALADLPAEPALRPDTLMEFALPDGRTLAGHVLEVEEKHARVDFNHPLAGRTLEFEFELVRILTLP